MSFASGFKDGFSYYLSLAERKDDEKLRAAKLETESLRQQAYRADLEASEEAKKAREFKESDIPVIDGKQDLSGLSLMQREQLSKTKAEEYNFNEIQPLVKKEADLKLSTAQTKNTQAQMELDLLAQGIQDEEDRKAFYRVANTYRLLSEGRIDPVVAASFLEEDLLTLRDNIDFTKFLGDDYMKGWQRITPKIESGDFASIVEQDSDVLTTIFKERLNLFKGKTFVGKDGRKGIIKNVGFSGDFDAIKDSANMVVGGNFEVLFEGGEQPETVFSYLPDNASALKEIKQDQQADDAKVVSVADVVDRVSAEKDFAMFLVNNLQAYETFKVAAKGAISFEGREPDIKAQVDQYFKLKKNGETKIGTIFSNADKARADLMGSESAYLESLLKQEPAIVSKYVVNEGTDLVPDYVFKASSSVADIQDDLVKKYADPQNLSAEVSNAFATFGDLAERSDGRKPFYFLDGDYYRFDTKKTDLDSQLEEKYVNFEALKNMAEVSYERANGVGSFDKLTPEQYLAFMTSYLEEQEK
jgi:hypothetical protein